MTVTKFLFLSIIIQCSAISLFAQLEEEYWTDSLNYSCSYDGVLNNVTKRVFTAKDILLVDQILSMERAIRFSNYLFIWEGYFINTAGAAWIKNNQAMIYNPDQINAIRKLSITPNQVQLLTRGIFLHEMGHHMMPHTIFRIIKKDVKPVDIIEYETEADSYMGQFLKLIFEYSRDESIYVVKTLATNPSILSLTDRIKAVSTGWEQGRKLLEDREKGRQSTGKMEVAYSKIQKVNHPDKMEGKWKSVRFPRFPSPSIDTLAFDNTMYDSLLIKTSSYSAVFKLVKEKDEEYLEANIGLFNSFSRLGKVIASNHPNFQRMAYDKFFVFWYISKDGEVFSTDKGNFHYLGNLTQN